MGFLKELGKGLGDIVGTVTGEPVKWVGKKISEKGNKEAGEWISGVGKGIQTSTKFAGERIGETASGIYGLAESTIKQDSKHQANAFKDLNDGVGKTFQGVGNTIKHTATNISEVANGVVEGDEKRWKEGLKNVTTTAAVGVLGVSILDAGDVIDINGSESGIHSNQVSSLDSTPNEYDPTEKTSIENPNTHHVDAHYVEGHWRDGQWIEGYWRDGDGNTDIDTYAGYEQSNPDYKA